jgi:hypothetical protein
LLKISMKRCKLKNLKIASSSLHLIIFIDHLHLLHLPTLQVPSSSSSSTCVSSLISSAITSCAITEAPP